MATFALHPRVTLRSEDTVALPGPSNSFGLPDEEDDSRLVKKEKRHSDGPEKEKKFAEALSLNSSGKKSHFCTGKLKISLPKYIHLYLNFMHD